MILNGLYLKLRTLIMKRFSNVKVATNFFASQRVYLSVNSKIEIIAKKKHGGTKRGIRRGHSAGSVQDIVLTRYGHGGSTIVQGENFFKYKSKAEFLLAFHTCQNVKWKSFYYRISRARILDLFEYIIANWMLRIEQ